MTSASASSSSPSSVTVSVTYALLADAVTFAEVEGGYVAVARVAVSDAGAIFAHPHAQFVAAGETVGFLVGAVSSVRGLHVSCEKDGKMGYLKKIFPSMERLVYTILLGDRYSLRWLLYSLWDG